MNRIEIIIKKLDELRTLDQGFSIFGSEKHKYQLNRTFTEEEIHQIEVENGILLSIEYKNILTHLGDGVAGCGYGLERLSLEKIHPPYIGTSNLLRNWSDPKKIDCDMVDLNEISGYIKLFDYGCGMEYCLIVNGAEQGELFFFDCDGRFEKITNRTLFDIYEDWLDDSLHILNRVKQKLDEMSLQEVIDSEWKINNYAINSMIFSIIGAAQLEGTLYGIRQEAHLEKEYKKWKNKNQNASNRWWEIWKK
ncbi:MAG: hypothetical protein IT260_00830 [Saprospiraceae bacterium]|nr:hypothetical protein [Saprospiraceae bacterium]